jgi:hypothetical protein
LEIPNNLHFEKNKLIITKEDFPNLKTLYACGLGLAEVELDCPNLENLYLVGNKLTEIDLSKTPNLVNLLINKNRIRKINASHLKSWEDLRCNNNSLYFPDSYLDVSGCENLVNLDCSECFMKKLILGKKHKKLAILDADYNPIYNLNFPTLPNLRMLSLRGVNDMNEKNTTLQLRSPKLMFLDYYKSKINKVVHVLGLKKSKQLRISNNESYTNPDGTYNPDVPTD